MLVESANYDDFITRINKIKTDSVKKEAVKYFTNDELCDEIKRFHKEDCNNPKKFQLFWDTVLMYHRFRRKIDEKIEKDEEKEAVNK